MLRRLLLAGLATAQSGCLTNTDNFLRLHARHLLDLGTETKGLTVRVDTPRCAGDITYCRRYVHKSSRFAHWIERDLMQVVALDPYTDAFLTERKFQLVTVPIAELVEEVVGLYHWREYREILRDELQGQKVLVILYDERLHHPSLSWRPESAQRFLSNFRAGDMREYPGLST